MFPYSILSKKFFRTMIIVAVGCSTFASAFGGEAAEVVKKYFSFFNPGENTALEDFRSCFPPEYRGRIRSMPSERQRTKSPVGKVTIIKEVYENDRCEVVFELQNRDGTGHFRLIKLGGEWFIDPKTFSRASQTRKNRK